MLRFALAPAPIRRHTGIFFTVPFFGIVFYSIKIRTFFGLVSGTEDRRVFDRSAGTAPTWRGEYLNRNPPDGFSHVSKPPSPKTFSYLYEVHTTFEFYYHISFRGEQFSSRLQLTKLAHHIDP